MTKTMLIESWSTQPTPEVSALRQHATDVALARSIGDLLYWDDRVTRPEKAAPWRAAQRATQAGLLHDLITSDHAEQVISEVENANPNDLEAKAMRAERTRVLSVPRDVWAKREEIASAARPAWDQARVKNDFKIFEPHLTKMVEVMREFADRIGYENERYEACLAEWEPGLDIALLDHSFASLAEALQPLLKYRNTEPKKLTLRELTPDVMTQLEREILDAVGFDLEAGLVVSSTRAFCIGLGPNDVRMTSRFHVTPCFRGIHSTLHEAGHGIYAQSFGRLGVPATLAMTPGLGLDEAQSRMIENIVGRSKPFLRWVFSRLCELAPSVYPSMDEFDQFYKEVNTADSPLRRLGTDELSYNLHILVRYRVERALMNGEIEAPEVPELWNATMIELLGAEPDTDTDGCLQDVHWSLGQWGYFPTYTLGNIYGLQLLDAAGDELADLDKQLAQGDTSKLRAWFDQNVYRHGRAYTGSELVEKVSGKPVSVDSLVRYLERKFVTD